MQSFRRIASSFFIFFLLIFSTSQLSAQSAESSGKVYVIAMLVIVGALILVSAILMLSENFIQLEATKTDMDADQKKSLVPSINQLWKSSGPAYANGDPVIRLKKGHDIFLNGEAAHSIDDGAVNRYAVKPTDYRGMAPIPKVVVVAGDKVKAGDVIFHDKKDDRVKFVSPVSGEVLEVRRGDKRAITDIIIQGSGDIAYKQFDPPSINEGSREEIVEFLCESGGWSMINERPFDVIPDPDSEPKNIFISTFDSAPLAPDLSFVIQGNEEAFQKGIDTLARLTSGEVYLGLDARGEEAPSKAFTDATNCKKHWFSGKHPSGNVGVQIHHVAPINVGDKVWTLTVQQVVTIGELVYKGRYNAERIVAIAGAQIQEPKYVRTHIGASIEELTAGQLTEGKNRIIEGDVLSGQATGEDTFLGSRTDQITAIKEGDYYEMFGWLLPLAPRPTISKTFPNFLFPNLKFDGDTNTHGEKRAFVVSGQYEKVLPMKIFPQHLMKAIMTGDFEQMEGLGIYELSEEDLALCEFTCTSKMPLQSILRGGLDMMREDA